MKGTTLYLILAGALFMFASCKKETDHCQFVAAKAIRTDCDRVIFQLLTPERIGDADWQDVHTGARYSNVVSYYNICLMGQLGICKGDTLYVRIRSTYEYVYDSGCFQCQAISNDPPQTKVDFIKMSKSACTVQSDF